LLASYLDEIQSVDLSHLLQVVEQEEVLEQFLATELPLVELVEVDFHFYFELLYILPAAEIKDISFEQVQLSLAPSFL